MKEKFILGKTYYFKEITFDLVRDIINNFFNSEINTWVKSKSQQVPSMAILGKSILEFRFSQSTTAKIIEFESLTEFLEFIQKSMEGFVSIGESKDSCLSYKTLYIDFSMKWVRFDKECENESMLLTETDILNKLIKEGKYKDLLQNERRGKIKEKKKKWDIPEFQWRYFVFLNFDMKKSRELTKRVQDKLASEYFDSVRNSVEKFVKKLEGKRTEWSKEGLFCIFTQTVGKEEYEDIRTIIDEFIFMLQEINKLKDKYAFAQPVRIGVSCGPAEYRKEIGKMTNEEIDMAAELQRYGKVYLSVSRILITEKVYSCLLQKNKEKMEKYKKIKGIQTYKFEI